MLRHEYTEINGLTFHCVVAGQGTAMIFLHGFPEFWYEWRHLLPEFAADHHVIAPDMRGYNLTEKPPAVEDYAVRVLVADIKAMFDHYSPGKKGILVAHDWGGAAAWSFAIAFPAYLEKLVIINAPHPGVFARELAANPAQQRASAYMLTFRSPEAEALLSANNYAALSKAVFEGSTKPEVFSREDREEYLTAWSQPGALTGGLNYYRAARLGPPVGDDGEKPTPFVRDAASLEVKVPTLVIWGENDRALLMGNLDGLDEYVPDLRIRRIPGASHWVIHEEPEVVSRCIREFLRGE